MLSQGPPLVVLHILVPDRIRAPPAAHRVLKLVQVLFADVRVFDLTKFPQLSVERRFEFPFRDLLSSKNEVRVRRPGVGSQLGDPLVEISVRVQLHLAVTVFERAFWSHFTSPLQKRSMRSRPFWICCRLFRSVFTSKAVALASSAPFAGRGSLSAPAPILPVLSA